MAMMWHILTAAAVWLLCLTTHSLAQDEHCVCLEQFGTEELRNPIIMEAAPGDDERVFIGEQLGLVWVYDREGNRNPEPFLNVSDRFELDEGFDTRGLLGLAFHPDFQENNKFYIYLTITLGPITNFLQRVAEFHVDEDNPDIADMDTERVIMDIDWHTTSKDHIGGSLFFGLVDGYLYIFPGDGYDFDISQDMSSHLGKTLRIDVNTGDDDIGYLVPDDNPFLEETGALPEIWALGLRNTWRCYPDQGDADTGAGRGRIFCGDVGQSHCEEIDIVTAGGNAAWSVKECVYCYPPPPPPEELELCTNVSVSPGEEVVPIYWYTEWAGPGGQSVTGGPVYRGSEMPAFYGDNFWTDWVVRDHSGINRLKESEDGSWSNIRVPLCEASVCTEGGLIAEHLPYAFAFGQDPDYELYIMEEVTWAPFDFGGVIYKIVVDPEMKKKYN